MREIKFRVWHLKEKRMYFRAYQKCFHVLLCDWDESEPQRGVPVKRAAFDDCVMMESTGLLDLGGHEIFEGDYVRIRDGEKQYEGIVEEIPDMFRSRKLHPLQGLMERLGLNARAENLVFEILGDRYRGKTAGPFEPLPASQQADSS